MPKMSGAQALIRSLLAEGVDTVFALPGAQIMAAFDALYEARDSIRMVHTRHEQSTTFMADGYAKSTGRVGVALVVPGPGALYASAGLGTAYASSSPVFLISGQIDSTAIGKLQGHLHEVHEQLDVFRPITKWVRRVTAVEEIPEAVHEAMRHLTSGRPRPVELEVPRDTLESEGEAALVEPEEYPRLAAGEPEIRRAAALLGKARRPAVIAGGGAIISGATKELIEIAELLQAPVMTTEDGKGVIPEDHYLAAGAYYENLGPAREAVPRSDVILAVGTRLFLPELRIEDHQKLVHIDADSREIGKNYGTEVGIVADAKEALAQLAKAVRAVGTSRESRRNDVALDRAALHATLTGKAPLQIGMVDAIRGALNDDAILVSGMTNIGYWSHLTYPVLKPRTYLTPSYFGTLGFAFPTALGAKVAHPDRQVVALSGDGGFLYGVGELATAVSYGINVVTLVFNNGAYGASRWDQGHRFGSRYIGTDLPNPDFVKLAESFGAVGMRTDHDGLGESLTEALTRDAPVVLEVVVPVMEPPF